MRHGWNQRWLRCCLHPGCWSVYVVFVQYSVSSCHLHVKCLHNALHLLVSELAAGISCEGRSLCLWKELIRCADVCPILFSAYSVNTVCAFHFSRLLFHSTRSALPPPHRHPQLASRCFSPFHPLSLSFSIPPSWLGAFCCKDRYFRSQLTHTVMFQAPMTVTDMYIMLSDSVRHASSLPLFIAKLFNVSGLWGPSVALCYTMTLVLQVLMHCCTSIWNISIQGAHTVTYRAQAARGLVGVLSCWTSDPHDSFREWLCNILDVDFQSMSTCSILQYIAVSEPTTSPDRVQSILICSGASSDRCVLGWTYN